MKLCVGVFLMIVGVSWAFSEGNGEPGCKTEIEIKVKNYRNLWDSTAYWICEQLGQPAGVGKCPLGTGWLDSQKRCVDWENWVWEEPVDTPSKP